ncbi:hypothetical protein CDAR_111791 [Caerostris darwini]|uniref:Uncharacterized protein n=1 Tax=Caerostris darwini TaxID=1538125 RepID=A0AAV4Q093_9ARAC|nr:hypothetical protein CDAR_111791 [Caerostris darwini]
MMQVGRRSSRCGSANGSRRLVYLFRGTCAPSPLCLGWGWGWGMSVPKVSKGAQRASRTGPLMKCERLPILILSFGTSRGLFAAGGAAMGVVCMRGTSAAGLLAPSFSAVGSTFSAVCDPHTDASAPFPPRYPSKPPAISA